MSKIKPDCVNRSVGQFLEAALSDRLYTPDRAIDRQNFFAHLDQCPACREAMLAHANDAAIEQVAMESGSTAGDLVNELAETARCLQESARRRGITLADAVSEILSRNKQMSLIAGEQGA